MQRANVYAYDFSNNRIPGDPHEVLPYWRDVGTIDAFYEANMDLRAITPALNLYNAQWPLGPTREMYPPAKFVFDQEDRRGHAIDSIISGGCILSGGLVRNSVLGRACACIPAPWSKTPSFSTTAISGAMHARCAGRSSTRTSRCPKAATIGYDAGAGPEPPSRLRKRHRGRGGRPVVGGGNRAAASGRQSRDEEESTMRLRQEAVSDPIVPSLRERKRNGMMKKLRISIIALLLFCCSGFGQEVLDLFPEKPGSLVCWTESPERSAAA